MNKNDNISKNFKWKEFLVSEDYPEIVKKYSLFNDSKFQWSHPKALSTMHTTANCHDFINASDFVIWLRAKIWFFTHNTLQPLRNIIDKPMIITSGWRPPELNDLIPGASKTSDHLCYNMSVAVDFKILGFEEKIEEISFYRSSIPYILDQTIIPFGQCIIYNSFVHISSITEKHQYEVIYK